jgi:hypothetical protein
VFFEKPVIAVAAVGETYIAWLLFQTANCYVAIGTFPDCMILHFFWKSGCAKLAKAAERHLHLLN